MNHELNIVELFSGIGSQVKALKNLGVKTNVLATCEWDMHAFMAYDCIHDDLLEDSSTLIHDTDQILAYLETLSLSNDGKNPMHRGTLQGYDSETLIQMKQAIDRSHNLIDVSKISGQNMPSNIDILTYSFPCQDLSNVGAFHGYNKGIDKDSGSRSSLLWQVGRILQEMQDASIKLPRYLIMENVPTLLSQRHFGNFQQWIQDLRSLGYVSKYFPLNAREFGIPQNRPRLLMLSVFVGTNSKKEKMLSNLLDKMTVDSIVSDFRQSVFYKQLTIQDLIHQPQNKRSKYWREAVDSTPNLTPSRLKIWNENPKIIREDGTFTEETWIRTLTTKQDRHPNSGNIYFQSGIQGKAFYRFLTPRECFLFMGFTEEDYEKIISHNPISRGKKKLFTRDKLIRMAGNSIPVQLLEGFFYQVLKIEEQVQVLQ